MLYNSPRVYIGEKINLCLQYITINFLTYLFTFQRWLNSLHEHCAYSTHYTTQPTLLFDEIDENFVPLGNVQDSFKVIIFVSFSIRCF
jgi:hypothetical protein